MLGRQHRDLLHSLHILHPSIPNRILDHILLWVTYVCEVCTIGKKMRWAKPHVMSLKRTSYISFIAILTDWKNWNRWPSEISSSVPIYGSGAIHCHHNIKKCKPLLRFMNILDTEDIFFFPFTATLRDEFADSGAFALDKTCLVLMPLGQWNINRFLMHSVFQSFSHFSEQE